MDKTIRATNASENFQHKKVVRSMKKMCTISVLEVGNFSRANYVRENSQAKKVVLSTNRMPTIQLV